MTISDPQLVTILVFLIAGLVLIQTLFLLVFADQVNREVRRAEISLARASKRASRTLQSTKRQLEQLSWLNDKLPVLAQEVDSLLGRTTEKARWLDNRLARDIQRSMAQVEEINRRVDFALHQFTRQTSKVRKWVRYPTHFLSAILRGTSAGLKAYRRNSHQRQPATHYPDDEIFI